MKPCKALGRKISCLSSNQNIFKKFQYFHKKLNNLENILKFTTKNKIIHSRFSYFLKIENYFVVVFPSISMKNVGEKSPIVNFRRLLGVTENGGKINSSFFFF
jgi:hypothetical protein